MVSIQKNRSKAIPSAFILCVRSVSSSKAVAEDYEIAASTTAWFENCRLTAFGRPIQAQKPMIGR